MGTRIRTHIKPKMRIISFVLAFVMVFVGLPYVGLEVNATLGLAIRSDGGKQSIFMSPSNSSTDHGVTYTYTGEISKQNKVTVFDYVSDYEINNNSYNNCSQNESGYVDAYTTFNTAISNQTLTEYILSPASQNITIKFKPKTLDNYSAYGACVYLWSSTYSYQKTAWPGIQMNYDNDNQLYYYTFSPKLLGFMPDMFIFNNNNHGVQTYDIYQSMSVNNTYTFTEGNIDDKVVVKVKVPNEHKNDDIHVYLWDGATTNSAWPGDSMTPEGNGGQFTYTTVADLYRLMQFNNGSDSWKTGDIEAHQSQSKLKKNTVYFYDATDGTFKNNCIPVNVSQTNGCLTNITTTHYKMPLYFACFWNDNKASGYYTPSEHNPKNDYNNFWWQTNIGLKTINDVSDAEDAYGNYNSDSFNVRGHAVAQGIVSDTLSTDTKTGSNYRGNLMQDAGGSTVELPYFSKDWADEEGRSTYIKYYDHDGDKGDIVFPFYEVTTPVSDTNLGSGKAITGNYQSNPVGDNTQQYARYYQFKSSDSNLVFDYGGNPNNHSGYFYESDTQIQHKGTTGFFPFNTSSDYNNSDQNDHNLGFGTKFEMEFKLQDDGRVGVTDSYGDDLDTDKYKSKVDTTFEFEGDDDLWVFIDGKLALDMGGAHFQSHGVINFATGEITVDKAIRMGDGSGYDDLGATVRTPSTTPVIDSTVINFKDSTKDNYKSILADGSFDGEGKYVKAKAHTMTIFYMERGMLDSNLLIRFNYSPEANFSKMKIAEATIFDNVNDGLQELTKKAAEDDVFKYTVWNQNTKTEDVKDNSAKYPTTARSIRTSQAGGLTTQLTPGYTPGNAPAAEKFVPAGDYNSDNPPVWVDNDGSYVKNTSYLWVDGFASTKKMVGLTTNSSGTVGAPGYVPGGDLWLMYGTCNDLYPTDGNAQGIESSAEFEKQFSKGSTMKIVQSNTLYSPKRKDGSTDVIPGQFSTSNASSANQLSASGRSVSSYYETSVIIRDRQHNPITPGGDGTFTFNNVTTSGSGIDPVDPTASVMLTEYFTNTPNVGAITIEKKVGKPGESLNYSQAANIIDEDTGESFDFRIQLKKVFGVEGVDVSDYSGIVVKKIDKDGNEDTTFTTLNNYENTSTNIYGTFSLKRGEKLTINKIPVGTEYLITEQSHDNYEQKSTTNSNFETIVKGNLNASNQAVDSNDTVVADRNETVVNVRRVGSLTLSKTVEGNTNETTFTFTGTLQGATGVDLKNYDISGTGVNLGTYNEENRTYPFTATVTVGTATVISGIPYGTKYTVDETLPPNATSRTISGDGGSTGTGTINNNKKDHSVNIKNIYPSTTEVDVEKKSSDGNTTLPGAEMELWYKETITPDTYTPSERQNVPNALNGMKVSKSKSDVGVPGLQTTTEKTKTYTYTTSYSNPSVPSSSDEDWILPRSDSDYIYFRDYNVGAPGEHDSASYNDIGKNGANTNNGQKRSWRTTNFAKIKNASGNDPGTHGQNLELDYDESYWFAAEFYGSGKKTVKYAMWERFVDKYENSTITTVWKIQPPDGYTQVRFILLKGDNWIRSTEKFTFKLGEIYHKKSWGGIWKYENGTNCYFDVPVNDESHTLWAPAVKSSTGSISDNRNTVMDQPRKYEPTEQKIIFHCNSSNVWHNIHIEFFTDTSGANRVNGQAFPGYMMEPYAYAGSDYRTSDGYLTYELTIPSTAKSFRITNGAAESSTYGYYTAVTQLNDGSDADHGKGNKNYANYFCFDSYADKGGTLKQWTNGPEGIPSKNYSDSKVTSDCDYVYFKAPSDWNNVYAYFYGGGNLRDDNWQRACYSAWPGVAPVGTEYDSTHSNTYSISTSGGTYNGTGVDVSKISPESYYTVSGEKIYKFRLPQGDRKNYSKVVFNDGLKSQGGGHETGVIDYEAGYIYSKDGSATKHYEKKPTTPYTGRTNSKYTGDDKTEYIYIKNSANWQDLHITFYDDKDKQILQGGHGYVMDYAGKDGKDYYRIPIPEDAVKFSVNNGIGKSAGYKTGLYDITRLGSNGKSTSEENASDRFVYNLEGTTSATLTRIGLNEGTPTAVESETVIAQVEDTSNYTPNTPNSGVRQTVSGTDDTLNIRDSYSTKWNLPIGAATVTFYNTAGAVVGSGTMMKTNADNDGYVWYTKKIPINAASFSVSYVKSNAITNTPKYPIYSKTADTTTGDQSTSGDMFYETAGTNKLSMIYAEPALDEKDDETYQKRGDDLYLVCENKTTPSITFYANGDNILRSGVTGKYINVDENGKHWYCVSIPKGAESFAIINGTGKYPIFELKSKYSRYEKDYTLGDMQYSYNGSTATLLYPIFTLDDEYTLSVSNDKTISSKSGLLTVDTSVTEPYANADSGITPATDVNIGSTLPVLYNTTSNDITYTWTETVEDENYQYIRLVDRKGWEGENGAGSNEGKIQAYFFDSASSPQAPNVVVPHVVESVYEQNSNGNNIYKFVIPTGDFAKVIFTNKIINDNPNQDWGGGHQTENITISDKGYGHGYLYANSNASPGYSIVEPAGDPANSTLTFINNIGWDDVWAELKNSSETTLITVHLERDGTSTTWTYNLSQYANYANVEKVVFKDGNPDTSSTKKTEIEDLPGTLPQKGWACTYTLNSSEYVYVRLDEWTTNSGQAQLYEGDGGLISGSEVPTWDNAPSEVTKGYKIKLKSTYTNVRLHVDGANETNSADITGWGGKYYRIGSDKNWHYVRDYDSSGTGKWSGPTLTYNPVQPASPTTYKVAYQPEDRYGMISEENKSPNPAGVLGFEDENNFIKLVIPNSITAPYIKFYTSTDASSGYINNDTSSNRSTDGFPLNDSSLKLNTSTYTFDKSTDSGNTTYKVRLPKNAKSFTITNGTRSGTHTLDESITVKVADGQLNPGENDDQKTISDFYHAGSTFTVSNNADNENLFDITLTDVRDGYTVTRQAALTDPLNPRSDYDYIFFTDTGDSIGGGSGTVYAYFYGGADGEYNNGSTANTYTPWPGIKATTANDGVAETTYTDNDGNTVYMFRVPHGENGNYPYVIFNNGVSGIKITQAAEVVAGKNYVLNTTASGQYGTFAASGNVYPVTPENKANTNPTVDYGSSSSKYIYIVNNGPSTDGTSRTPLDDMHVVFYDSSKNVIGTDSPGYKPDKVVENGNDKQYSDSDVYRIAAPSNAKYFQITNGTKVGTTYDNERMSEIKAITPDALYRFVPDGSSKYIEESTTPAKLSAAHFLLDIINVVTTSDEEISVDGTIPVHVATIVTGDDGKTAYIKWVKDYDPTRSSKGSIDSAYIANTTGDIGSDKTGKKVKVVKNGEYYWKESVAPSGYQINPANYDFTVPTTTSVTVPDPPNPTGKLTLNKKLPTVRNSPYTNGGEGQEFTFNVTLTAPVGTNWTTLNPTTLNPLPTFKKKTNSTEETITVSPSAANLTVTFNVSIPATGNTDLIIDNIPSGTYYSITETSLTNYSDTPVAISVTTNDGTGTSTTGSSDEISGMIPSYSTVAYNTVDYAVTNKRDVGGLTLEKVAEGSEAALATAGINQEDETTHKINYTDFTYTVTLTAPTGIDFRDYITWEDLTNADTGLGATVTKVNSKEAATGPPAVTIRQADYDKFDGNANNKIDSIRFNVSVTANNGSKLVKNLPIGTKYTVTEVDPTGQQLLNWSKSGEVTTATEMTATNLNPTVTITNSYGGSEIILTKTAKEKIGTTDIGSPLAGAEFLVYKNDGDSDDTNDVLAGKFTQAKDTSNNVIKGEYNFNNTSGTFNQIVNNVAAGLTTGDDSSVTDHYGKLILKGLPVGDYYLKEIKAPNGYSNLDSNNLKNGVAQPKRIYFSVGDNTKTKEISCADEMAPAYIKLFEHINEWRPSEWGNPTFIFKIKQTGYYAWSTPANEGDPSVWQLTATNSGKEILVALTVNDNGTLNTNVLTGSVTGKTFTGWKVESTDENIAVDENTTVKEYQGMFDIDSQGRIRVEPGSYEITRMPVSRYEFVTSAKTAPYDNSGTAGEQIENKDNSNKPLKTVTISPLEAGKTVDVHYYDEVGYYDKFSQVDTNVNQFYQLNSTTKANKTIKGIRIADYHQVGTTGNEFDTVEVNDISTNPVTLTEKLMTVPVSRLTIYKIMSDGSEVEMTDSEKAALTGTNFIVSYTYDLESGDKESFGHATSPATNDFSYDNTDEDSNDLVKNPSIVVHNSQKYENGVYTMKAKYKTDTYTEFTTTFDLVFLRSST